MVQYDWGFMEGEISVVRMRHADGEHRDLPREELPGAVPGERYIYSQGRYERITEVTLEIEL